MAAYPTEMPLFELRQVLQIVRSGEIAAQKSEFAKNLWWIQGYAQKLVLGDGVVSMQSVGEALPADTKPEEVLEKLISSGESGIVSQSLNPMWMWLIGYAAQMLADYLNNR
jgi:hypothetical protein